jgi:hypothetical protein
MRKQDSRHGAQDVAEGFCFQDELSGSAPPVCLPRRVALLFSLELWNASLQKRGRDKEVTQRQWHGNEESEAASTTPAARE